MIKRTCPFCESELSMEHNITFCDYFCNKFNHFFSERITDAQTDTGEFILDDDGKQVKELTKIKLCLIDCSGEKMYLKIDYDEHTSQVWTKDNKSPRILINDVFIPDYNNPKLIIKKIKSYLLFS
jgi:hypothetical protein